MNDVSAKVGLNLIPLLGDQNQFTALSLVYNPERYTYADASSENYTAHRVNAVVKAKNENVTLSIDDAFLYNDGNRVAPTYALNQLAGAAGN